MIINFFVAIFNFLFFHENWHRAHNVINFERVVSLLFGLKLCAVRRTDNDVNNVIYRGYSNFLLNMAFISSSEVENIYIS